MRQPLIQLQNVTKKYREGERERTVMDNAEVTIFSGETVALIGRSGSGKSTFLNIASGIDAPTSGRVMVHNLDIAQMHERERTLFRRKHIGFVFQFFNLIPTLTVEENVLLPLELNERTNERERALSLLRDIGLHERAKSFPDRLSGGEQQRVALARALVHDPWLILADEPTGNLDYETGRQVLTLLDTLVRQRGRTMVIATHSRDVLDIVDRVMTLREGKIVEVGKEDMR